MLAALAALSGSCAREVAGPGEQPGEVVPYTAGSRIAWDYRTLRRPFTGPASYPRMIRLRSGDLLLSLESRGASYVLRSRDQGATWSPPVEVAGARDGIIAAVPSLLQLRDGTVLLAYNPRPPQDNGDAGRRFGIRLAASTDDGRTWRERAVVYEAGHQWGRGAWEPALLELPSGELLIFVANEFPYAATDEQEISVLRSADQGRTWTGPQTVSFRAGHRDGMPVPLQLRDGSGIAVAIEDNGLVDGPFKPAIVWIPADGAVTSPVGGDSPLRWSALRDEDQLPAGSYGGAPFLAQFPDGETVLSFQSNEGRPGDWSQSTMVVALGDPRARSFSRKSEPFRVPPGRSALWGSVLVKDDSTVTALTTTDAYSGSTRELFLIDGQRIPEPRADSGTVRVDGAGGDAAWAGANEGRLGAYGSKTARFRTAWDAERFYVHLRVEERVVVATAGPSDQDDAVVLYLAPGPLAHDAPVAGAYRLRVEADGDLRLEEGREGEWVARDASGIVAAFALSSGHGSPARYALEVGIPWSRVGGRPEVGAGWGFNVELVDNDAGGSTTREAVSGTDVRRPRSWLRMELAR